MPDAPEKRGGRGNGESKAFFEHGTMLAKNLSNLDAAD
jgi:hypothetical protein